MSPRGPTGPTNGRSIDGLDDDARLVEDLLVDPCAPDVLEEVRHDRGPGTVDPVDELLDREDSVAVHDWLGPVLGKAALLKIHTGWSWSDVAPAVGLSPKALERRLRRFRDSHDPRESGANHA